MAWELAKRHLVTVLCSYTKGSKRRETLDGISVIRVGPMRQYSRSVDYTRIFYVLAAIWRGVQLDTDLIEGTNFINQFIAYQIGRIKKIPIVAWTPDVWQGQWSKNMGIIGGVIGALLERYNLSHRKVNFIAISRPVADKLIKFGVPKRLIKVIPCGVDLNWFRKIKQKKSLAPRLCTVSSLSKYKSVDVFIKAAALVLDKEPMLQIRIIGYGPEKARLMNLAKELGVSQQLKFLGFIKQYDELIREFKSARIFCFPSVTEGFGIVSVEAMAAGTPYVIANSPVNRSVTHNKGGLFFSPGDEADMAGKILRLLRNKTLYAKVRKEGQEMVKKYDWRIIAAKTEEIYARLYRY